MQESRECNAIACKNTRHGRNTTASLGTQGNLCPVSQEAQSCCALLMFRFLREEGASSSPTHHHNFTLSR